MMGIRDGTAVAPIPWGTQYHPCAPGHDVGPTWLGRREWAGGSWLGSPSRVGQISIVPIFPDGDLE